MEAPLVVLSGKAPVLLRDRAEKDLHGYKVHLCSGRAASHTGLVFVGKGEVWGLGVRVEAC